MACSPARLLANRRNALKSTGPTTLAGKFASRRNALKHGMTGAGAVIPGEDADAVTRLCDELQPEIAPGLSGAMARILVRRVAVMSVRIDRCVRQEAAALAEKVRCATDEFDEIRRAKADHLLSWIATEPATNHRQLLAMPEGVELLLDTMESFRQAITSSCSSSGWGMIHAQRFDECTGRRPETVPLSRCHALSAAIGGRFDELGPDDAPELSPSARSHWARDRIAELIDAESDRLEAHLAALDPAKRAQSRDQAADRALFDPESEATAARKYEAAAERAMFRALRELKEMGQAADAGTLDLAAESAGVTLYEAQADDHATQPELVELASFCPEPELEPEAEPRPATPHPRRRMPTVGRLASFCQRYQRRVFGDQPTKKGRPGQHRNGPGSSVIDG